jgi:predicted transcriptional regulator
VKVNYKNYYTILRRVIIEAKKLHHTHQIKISFNKVNTLWKIIKDTIGRTQSFDTIKKINSEVGQITHANETANVFNNYLIQTATNCMVHTQGKG